MTIKMKIIYTKHAEMKFADLGAQGFLISVKQVEDALKKPDVVLESRKGRFVAQKAIDATHMLRVIYEKDSRRIRIITFYPARRRQYGY
jgi:hypothetical protein